MTSATTHRPTTRLLLALALAGLVCADAAAASAAETVRIVVAAGNNSGLEGEDRLRYAVRDARRFSAVMIQLGGVAREHTFLLADDGPAAFEAALAKAAALSRRHDEDRVELLVYYSGHGSEDALHVAGTRLARSRVDQLMRSVPARLRMLVVDACRSHGGRDKGLETDQTFAIQIDTPTEPSGVVTVQSSGPGESAQESDDLGGAVFTHYLVSGLRGAADRDRDQRVSFDEAYSYAYHRTLRHSAMTAAGPQRAWSELEIEGAGSIVMTNTSAARSTLRLPAGRDIQYFVYSLPSGAVVTEVWSDPDAPRTIALPAGRFLVQRRQAARHGAATVRLPWGGSADLEPDDFDDAPHLDLARKGRGGLVWVRHELGGAYGLVAHGGPGLGHRIRVRYGFRLSPSWVLGGGLELGLMGHRNATNEVQERWLGGDVRVGLRIPSGPVELRLGAAALLRGMDQRLTPVDSDRHPPGSRGGDRTSGLAVGAEASAGVFLPLAGAWALEVALTGGGLAVEQSGGFAPRWHGSFDLGLAVEL